jgi:hypothetical protein
MATLEEVTVWRFTTRELDLQVQISATVISGGTETQDFMQTIHTPCNNSVGTIWKVIC